MLQDVVARQDGKLERIQAKGMVGDAVIAKFDFPKPKDCSNARWTRVDTMASGRMSVVSATSLFGHRDTTFFVVPSP